MDTRAVIPAFDEWLAARGLRFEAIVVGGAALNMLGVVQRETKDCDVLVPMIPEAIRRAAAEFAEHHSRQEGPGLGDEWINNGTASMVPILRPGWRERLAPVYRGEALALDTLDRVDLLGTKLFALCDRGLGLDDCLAMGAPSMGGRSGRQSDVAPARSGRPRGPRAEAGPWRLVGTSSPPRD